MQTETDLIHVADIYAAALDVSETTVSSRVFADSKKLRAVRDGASITVKRFNEALIWFSRNWPDGAVWPSHVERPSSSEGAAA